MIHFHCTYLGQNYFKIKLDDSTVNRLDSNLPKNIIQCSPLHSNSRGQICSNYEFALNIKCKYNRLSKDHNHLSELTKPELSGIDCNNNKYQVLNFSYLVEQLKTIIVICH